MENFCKLLPKTELHAHLNGSVRDSTMKELYELRKQQKDFPQKLMDTKLPEGNTLTFNECFKVFDVILEITNDPKIVERIAIEMVEDHCAENVRYLEIRSTPKNLSSTYLKSDYIESVLKSIKEGKLLCEKKYGWSPSVKYLISVNRSESKEEVEKSVELALKYNKIDPNLVGVELCGNPYLGNIQKDFLPSLKKAKEGGLFVSLHIAELPNTFEENQAMLEMMPHRLGHACFLNEQQKNFVMQNKIPIEICLTSNIISNTYQHLDSHHFDFYWKNKHPIILCCDDRGVFSTTNSKEYLIASDTWKLSQRQLADLSLASLDHCFIGNEERNKLKEEFGKIIENILDK